MYLGLGYKCLFRSLFLNITLNGTCGSGWRGKNSFLSIGFWKLLFSFFGLSHNFQNKFCKKKKNVGFNLASLCWKWFIHSKYLKLNVVSNNNSCEIKDGLYFILRYNFLSEIWGMKVTYKYCQLEKSMT